MLFDLLQPHAPVPKREGVLGFFLRWLTAGVEPLADPRQRIKVLNLNLTVMLVVFICTLFVLTFAWHGKWGMIRTGLVQPPLAAAILFTLRLNQQRRYTLARLNFVVWVCIYISIIIMVGQGVYIYTHYYLLLGAVMCYTLMPLEEWPFILILTAATLGLFYLFSSTQWPPHPDFLTLSAGWLLTMRLTVVVSCVALAIYSSYVQEMATEVYLQLLQRTAMRDSLTGLPNRRYGISRLDELLQQHRREGLPLMAAVVDVDHFKWVNDTLGHDVGDHVLQHIAGMMRTSLRGGDTVARLGGEEFLVVLPHTDANDALMVLDNLRETIASTPYEWTTTSGQRLTSQVTTISIGLASSEPVWDCSQLLHAADSALYEAKSAGRNRVVLAGLAQKTMPGPLA